MEIEVQFNVQITEKYYTFAKSFNGVYLMLAFSKLLKWLNKLNSYNIQTMIVTHLIPFFMSIREPFASFIRM